MTTVTTSQHHGFAPGQKVSITVPDRRWWRRLWYLVTFRRPPTTTKVYTIRESTSTTFTIKP